MPNDAAPDTLSAVCPHPITVKVDGEDVTLRPLTPRDFAAAEQHIRESRVRTMIAATRQEPLSAETRGQALAAILAATVTYADVFESNTGRAYLIWLAVDMPKKPHFEDFLKRMDSAGVGSMADIVLAISGIAGEQDADPT